MLLLDLGLVDLVDDFDKVIGYYAVYTPPAAPLITSSTPLSTSSATESPYRCPSCLWRAILLLSKYALMSMALSLSKEEFLSRDKGESSEERNFAFE